MNSFVLLPFALLLSTAIAQLSLVLPGYADTEAPNSSVGPIGQYLGSIFRRSQYLFDASFFSATLNIQSIAFRWDAGSSGVSFTSPYELRLSTTSKVDDGLSVTFAENVGPDEVTVFTGELTIPSPAGGSPQAFDIVFNFQTEFEYDPAQGNLLLEVLNFDVNQGVEGGLFDAILQADDGCSRVYSSNGAAATSETGTLNSDCVITQFNGVVPPTSSPAPSVTDQPSLLPTRENQLNVRLLPFYVALRLPGGAPNNEPSQDDFEQLRLQTERFVDNTLRGIYMAGRRRRRGLQNLAYVYNSVSLVTMSTQYRGGIPEPAFNIYASYGGTVIFYGMNATMNETQPTQDDLADLISESNLTDYISDYVSEIPAFDEVEDARTGAEADVVSFSPTVSRVPSSLPSPFPSTPPSLVPSPVPTPSPTMSPTEEVCPCGRFRILCRVIRFRRCILGDE